MTKKVENRSCETGGLPHSPRRDPVRSIAGLVVGGLLAATYNALRIGEPEELWRGSDMLRVYLRMWRRLQLPSDGLQYHRIRELFAAESLPAGSGHVMGRDRLD